MRSWSCAEGQGWPSTLAVPASPFGEQSVLCGFGCKHATIAYVFVLQTLSPNLLRPIFTCASAALTQGEPARGGHTASLEYQGHCRWEQRKMGGTAPQGGSGHPARPWWGCAEACALIP